MCIESKGRVRIAALRNGTARYARRILAGFRIEAERLLGGTGIELELVDRIGAARIDSLESNREQVEFLFERLTGPPDYFLAIGTQVSIDCRRILRNRCPLICLGVGLAEEAGLADVPVVAYGPPMTARMKFVDQLLPSTRVAFLYSGNYHQDRAMAADVDRLAKRAACLCEFSTVDWETSAAGSLDEYGAIFGFYFLNRELEAVLEITGVPVIGLDEVDVLRGAVASTGTNDLLIGEVGADLVIGRHLRGEGSLDEVGCVEVDDGGYFLIHLSNCRKRGLAIELDRALEIADLVFDE